LTWVNAESRRSAHHSRVAAACDCLRSAKLSLRSHGGNKEFLELLDPVNDALILARSELAEITDFKTKRQENSS
jgi:hypothetical protein